MVSGERQEIQKDKPTKNPQPLSCPETECHSAAREMDSEGQKEGTRGGTREWRSLECVHAGHVAPGEPEEAKELPSVSKSQGSTPGR